MASIRRYRSLIRQLDADIVTIELSVSFELDSLPMTIDRKPDYVPVVNRGYMWSDSENHIYTAGGHFFTQAWWDESAFHRQKADIPDYSIWKYDLNLRVWIQIKPIGDKVIRLISSGYTSIPSTNLSYSYG